MSGCFGTDSHRNPKDVGVCGCPFLRQPIISVPLLVFLKARCPSTQGKAFAKRHGPFCSLGLHTWRFLKHNPRPNNGSPDQRCATTCHQGRSFEPNPGGGHGSNGSRKPTDDPRFPRLSSSLQGCSVASEVGFCLYPNATSVARYMEFVTNHLTVSGGASQSVGPAADFVASHALVVPCCHGNAQAFVAYVSIEHSGVMIIATQIQPRKLDGDESDAALPSSLEMLQEPSLLASSVAIQTRFYN